ncbi:MAG: GerAB/ArcD/ProY family transporter [Bacillota bacterium]
MEDAESNGYLWYEGNMKDKITSGQFLLLVTLFTIGTSILNVPSGLAAEAKQDGWIAAIIAIGMGFLIVWTFTRLGDTCPQMTIIEINEYAFGKWIGGLISILLVFFSLFNVPPLLFYMGNFMITNMMPETPIEAFNIIFILVVIMGLRLGIETIARTGEILFPWVVFLFVILVLLLCPQIKMDNIQPVLETGVKSLFRAALSLIATSHSPFIVLFMIYPSSVNTPKKAKKAKKAFFIGTFIGGLVMIIITFLSIAILGSEQTARHQYPSFTLAKKVSIGDFIQRIEALIAAIWFITIYFKMTLYFYCGVVGFAQLLKIKDYRPLLMPLGMIVTVFSLVVYPNTVYMSNWDEKTWVPYSLTFGFVLPLLLLGMTKLKRNSSH